MPSPPTNPKGSGEVIFDITKPGEGVTFLGLLDPANEPGNKLTGLFDWQCRECGAVNRDAVIVEPQQAFLAHWLCSGCEQTLVMRFRARSSAEWVAEHTLAVTGQALCHLAEDEFVADAEATGQGRRTSGNQRVFAWIAVPALVALVFLGLSDMRRLSGSSAAPTAGAHARYEWAALSRLSGLWLSESDEDRLYFGHIDAASRRGTYVHFVGGRHPGKRMRFEVIHADPRGEQLVVRQWGEPPTGAKAQGSPAGSGVEASIHIPLAGRSLTWIDMEGDRPVLKVYHRVVKAAPAEPAD